ncbi:MAG: hypothetical protein JNM60_08655 [Candidatus Competibacteraceae bacterium]|nr:hypothetical protein [Candidatus Competibacteraceae bacterium]
MHIQIDELTLISAIASAAGGIIVCILGGIWRLLGAFKSDLSERLDLVETGLEDRQEAWRKMLESHIQAETLEFESLHELRRELALIRQELEAGYPTRREMNDHLSGMRLAIEEIRRIVDARKLSGADPVSGRPVGGERRGTAQ